MMTEDNGENFLTQGLGLNTSNNQLQNTLLKNESFKYTVEEDDNDYLNPNKTIKTIKLPKTNINSPSQDKDKIQKKFIKKIDPL